LQDVGHSAGVFDIDKLAWVNRHYLKAADPGRLARLSIPYLQQRGWASEPTTADLDFLQRIIPAAAGSVDRLEQVPGRLAFLFDYSATRALAETGLREEALASHAVIAALAEELSTSGRLADRDAFRTGQKGKALFHPIRLALTGEKEGLELDLAVPAIEAGAALQASGITPIPGAAERAREFASALGAL
jgi:glutamyl-tRNA synthetase/nondiscriminating glutamyl-tRNA synthetase